MLFPLRELTAHIIGAKNIRREWGRTGAGVGLRGGADLLSFSLFKCIYLFFCSNKSPDSLCVILRVFFFVFFWSEISTSIPREELGRGAAVAASRQSEVGA